MCDSEQELDGHQTDDEPFWQARERAVAPKAAQDCLPCTPPNVCFWYIPIPCPHGPWPSGLSLESLESLDSDPLLDASTSAGTTSPSFSDVQAATCLSNPAMCCCIRHEHLHDKVLITHGSFLR